MTRFHRTEGIIIRRRNFGEADRVLTILTPNYGKIQVRAPGVRRIASRRSSHIELFNLSLLSLYKSSRSLLSIVTEAKIMQEFLPIRKSLGKIALGFYICELIDSLCPQNQENRRIFFLLRDTLFKLSNYSLGSNGAMKQWNNGLIGNFESELLALLGFLPRQHKISNNVSFIESILERKLNTQRLLPLFLSYSKG